MYRDEHAKLSKEELIALVLAQAAQIEELTRRVAELEAKLGGPPKTPDNSSIPPSQPRRAPRGKKAQRPSRGVPGARPQSGSDHRERGGTLPALRAGADPSRSVRLSRWSLSSGRPKAGPGGSYRAAADSPGDHPRPSPSWGLPELPPWLQRTRARGHRAGLALWPGFDRPDPAPARHPGNRL